MSKIPSLLIHFALLIATSNTGLATGTNFSLPELTNFTPSEKTACRLPNTVKPIRYDLHPNIYLDEHDEKNFTFTGVVKIVLMIREETKTVVLHSKNLEIRNVKLTNDYNETMTTTWNHDPENHFLTIRSESKNLILNDSYTVEVEYEGKVDCGVSQDVGGFTANFYIDKNGNKM